MPMTSSLPIWFANAIQALQAGDVDGWMEMYSQDAVHEFPFAPEGASHRLEGRNAIAAYMRQLPARIRFGALSDICVRERRTISSSRQPVIIVASRITHPETSAMSGLSNIMTARSHVFVIT